MLRLIIKWALPASASLLAVLAVATRVFAHADYDHSTPGRDEVVPAAPAQVDVFFKQDVKKVTGRYFVRVYEGSGAVPPAFCEAPDAAQVSDGDGLVNDDDRTLISATLRPDLPGGRYVVCWMTTSDLDDDEATGAFCFYAAAEPSDEQAAECAAFDEEEPAATDPAGTTTAGGTATEPPGGGTATMEPTAVAPTATSVAPGYEGSDDGGVSAGVIIGIVAGVIAVVVVAGGVALWLRRT